MLARVAPLDRSLFSEEAFEIHATGPVNGILKRVVLWTMGGQEFLHFKFDSSKSFWERRRWVSRTAAMALTWILTGICGILWGSVYVYFSLSRASMPPFLYSAACFLGFLSLHGINKFQLAKIESTVFAFRQMQLILILILPFLMHIVLGGLKNSSASCVMSWSIIAPAGAIFYCHQPNSRRRAIANSAKSLSSSSNDALSPVLSDWHVRIAFFAYVSISIVMIAIDPLLPFVDPPPLLLRQVG